MLRIRFKDCVYQDRDEGVSPFFLMQMSDQPWKKARRVGYTFDIDVVKSGPKMTLQQFRMHISLSRGAL